MATHEALNYRHAKHDGKAETQGKKEHNRIVTGPAKDPKVKKTKVAAPKNANEANAESVGGY